MPDTYSYIRTRNQIVTTVLEKHGAIANGGTVDAGDAGVVNQALDLRLKEMHALGTLWYQVAGATSDVALLASIATATAPADFLFPISMSVRIVAEDIYLRIIGHREYQAIPNKTDTGEPKFVFVSGQTFRFWPVPNANYIAKLTYEAIAADSLDATAPDIPIAMVRSLINLIVYDVADNFSTKDGKAARLMNDAKMAERTIKNLNAERVDIAPVKAEYF